MPFNSEQSHTHRNNNDPQLHSNKAIQKAPYKLLALDGGGIRGVLSLEILAELEQILGDALRQSGQIHREDRCIRSGVGTAHRELQLC